MKTIFALVTILGVGMTLSSVADAAGKKKLERANFSKEQQAKIFARGLAICRKKYGTSLHYIKVDYAKDGFICYHY